MSLNFSNLSDMFARCLNTDLWAAWQQQKEISHFVAHISKNLSAGNGTTAPLKRNAIIPTESLLCIQMDN